MSVERPEMVESTSLGAALAASIGIKLTTFNAEDDSHQVIISSTFYILHVYIPKAQKDTGNLTVFLPF